MKIGPARADTGLEIVRTFAGAGGSADGIRQLPTGSDRPLLAVDTDKVWTGCYDDSVVLWEMGDLGSWCDSEEDAEEAGAQRSRKSAVEVARA